MMEKRLFSELGLSPEILKAVAKLGFEQASPIQSAAIPVIMTGKDVVGQSQTGSGKTAAFGIPAIEKIDPAVRKVQVLILCPTRELAVQVAEEILKLSLFKRGVHATPIYGGQSYDRQYRALQSGVQIVIGTPGRVMDHMRRGTLRLDSVKMVVLDEADEMLNMGFREDIEFVLQNVPTQRQTVFFSATLPKPIKDLIRKFAKDPATVAIEHKVMTVPTVEQVYYEVDRRSKIDLLARIIDIEDLKLGIIFCNTKKMVDELVDDLTARGYSADRLHGDMSQGMRERVMNKFRQNTLEFLVATDVAARGIDVDHVQVVFNYDIPYDEEDYVHRIGRTGRVGRSGKAVTFVSGKEIYTLQQIERYTKQKIRREKIPTSSEVEEKRLSLFVEKIKTTLEGGQFKQHERILDKLLEQGFSATDIACALLQQLFGEEIAENKRAGADFALAANAPAREPRERREPNFENRGEWRERPERPVRDRPAKPGMQKVFINVGSNMNVTAKDVVGAILGETGIPPKCVGAIDIRDKHLLVDIAEEHVQTVIDKLSPRRIKGLKLNVKRDGYVAGPRE